MIYIFIAIVLLGLFLKKTNIVNLLSIVFLTYLVSTATFIPDFPSYEYIYEHINSNQTFGMGTGWYWLNNLGREFNLTYVQFRTILVLLSLILISFVIYYFLGNNPNMIWGLYLIYPIFLDLVQIRFFFALSISLLALTFLSRQKWWSTVFFVILISIAIRIHSSTAFFISFSIIPLIKKHEKNIGIFIGFITLFLILFRGWLVNIVSLFASERQTYYFSATNASWLIVIMYNLLILFFYFITYEANSVIENSSQFNLKEKGLSYLSSGINLVMLLLIPLSWISSEFLRLQRISWIFIYMILYIFYKHNEDIKLLNIRVNSKVLAVVLAIFGYGILIMCTSPLAFTSFF